MGGGVVATGPLRSAPGAVLALLLAAMPAAGRASPGEGRRGVPGPVLLGTGRRLPLDVALHASPAGSEAPMPPLAWRQVGEAAVGEASDAVRSVEVRLTPRGAGLSLEVRVRYLQDVQVQRESVRFRLPGAGTALGRDLAWGPLRRPLRVDRGTPVLVAAGEVLVAGGPGIVAARYVPQAGGAAVEVELVVDDEASHPFTVYDRCLPKLPETEDGQVSYRALEQKHAESRMPRRAGEEAGGRAALYLLAPGEPPLPLVTERWPAGARAAVVFTDHADRTDPEALRAVMHGDSREICRAAGPGGFVGRGLRITKSFFVRARRGGLEEPETAALARELARAGSEVASHSPSAAPDDREATRAALEILRGFGAVTWIDHQPYTNCEALSSEGWRDDGPFAVRDLLAGAGFRWVWEAGDVGGFAAEPALVNLFAPARPAAVPPLYPMPQDPRLWVFGSTMFQGTPEALGRALSDEALSRLEDERGLFVAHTYLAASQRTTTSPSLAARLVVRPAGEGLEIQPDLDAGLARIAARVGEGTLASLTWDEAGRRLRALGDLEVEYRADGSAAIVNHGPEAVEGLTLAVPAQGWTLVADGREIPFAPEGGALEGQGPEGTGPDEMGPDRPPAVASPPGRRGPRAVLDLPAGGTAVLRAREGGAPVPFLATRPLAVRVERVERATRPPAPPAAPAPPPAQPPEAP